jgi:hypothetical protein
VRERGFGAVVFRIPPLPSTVAALPGKAVFETFERISGHFKSTGQRVVIIAVGCLTNVALLLAVFPEVRLAVFTVSLSCLVTAATDQRGLCGVGR